MKRFAFNIDQYQVKQLLLPIRTKSDIISLWMNVIKIITTYVEVSDANAAGQIVLIVSNMSRLFIASTDKTYSINFPFFVKQEDDGLIIYAASSELIDNKISSEILALIETEKVLLRNDVLSFAEPIIDSCEIDRGIWELFRDLMLIEDGYIRADFDPDRENGHLHPLHHLDVFYSNASTFKIGARKRIAAHDLMDILDTSTNCHYIASGT